MRRLPSEGKSRMVSPSESGPGSVPPPSGAVPSDACVPVASLPRRWVGWALLAAALLAAGGAAAVLCWPASPPADDTAARDADLAEPVLQNPGYVGAQACAACHAERVEQFQATNHL